MKNQRTRTEWLLSAPSLLWMTLFFLVPAVIVFVLAFRPADPLGGVGAGWTLDHWRALFDEQYRPILWRTMWVSTVTSMVCVILAVPCALVMARARGAWKNVLLLLVVVPFWTNFLIRVFAWKSLLHPDGPVTRAFLALRLMGEDSQLLYNNGAVLLVMVYTQLPFAILPLYAAAEKFDFGLLEAARDLGASAWRAIWSVFLPGVSDVCGPGYCRRHGRRNAGQSHRLARGQQPEPAAGFGDGRGVAGDGAGRDGGAGALEKVRSSSCGLSEGGEDKLTLGLRTVS
jgi:ABC-type spermidine/putrescine transport system permease subunit I